MAGMAAKAVEAYFEDKDTRAQVVNDHLLTLNWGFNGGTMTIFLDFAEDDTHVHIEKSKGRFFCLFTFSAS